MNKFPFMLKFMLGSLRRKQLKTGGLILSEILEINNKVAYIGSNLYITARMLFLNTMLITYHFAQMSLVSLSVSLCLQDKA